MPFGEQGLQHGLAFRGETIKAFVAFVFFAPFADEQALGFEAAEQRVESAFIDGHALVGEGLAEGVAVLLFAEHGQDGEDQRATAKFEAEVFKELVVVGTGRHIVYDAHCMVHSIGCQELFLRATGWKAASWRFGRHTTGGPVARQVKFEDYFAGSFLCRVVHMVSAVLGSTALSPSSTNWMMPCLSMMMLARRAHS